MYTLHVTLNIVIEMKGLKVKRYMTNVEHKRVNESLTRELEKSSCEATR